MPIFPRTENEELQRLPVCQVDMPVTCEERRGRRDGYCTAQEWQSRAEVSGNTGSARTVITCGYEDSGYTVVMKGLCYSATGGCT
jgi:hypothetical protein